MDWFQEISGFRETNYKKTKSQFEVSGTTLRSRVNNKSYEIGKFDLISLRALRAEATSLPLAKGQTRVSLVRGDVGELHRAPEAAGALFQVASQFNSLEMTSPRVTPEDGVTRYQSDRTQGPACAIAAGAATIYRNYFVPFEGGEGQTKKRQLNGLTDVGEVLGRRIGIPPKRLWDMRNGYALPSKSSLKAIGRHLEGASTAEIDELRAALKIGFHRGVEVTTAAGPEKQLVSQVFCSALPVAYSRIAPGPWEPFGRLALEAAYEATMWSALLNAKRTGSNVVYLTLVGGGAFGNPTSWIVDATSRALGLAEKYYLDVRIVSYGSPNAQISELVNAFQ